MPSKAQEWWDGLKPESRTVAAARSAVRMARLELAYLRMRARKLKDSWLLTHGIDRGELLAELDLAMLELAMHDRGLAALPSYAPASALKHPLARVVKLEEDPAKRKAISEPSRMVSTPLIAWPGRILAELGEEEKARADQTWSRAAADIADAAADVLPDPGALSTGATVAIAVGAGVVLLGGIAFAAVAMSR